MAIRRNLELAKVGRWETSTLDWEATQHQFADAVRAFDSGKFRKPVIKPGHRDPRFVSAAHDGDPALGRIVAMRTSDDGNTLLGDVEGPEWLFDSMNWAFPHRSIEADLSVELGDDHFAMVTKGLALLGVTPPAIHNLADLERELAASAAEQFADYTAAVAIAASVGDPAGDQDGGPDGDADASDDDARFMDWLRSQDQRAAEVATAREVVMAAWTESLHPRAGGKFAAKGSGYSKAPAGAGATRGGQTQTADPKDVKALQQRLMRLGFLKREDGKNGHAVDGLFGPKTEAALKAYQKSAGLNPTGHISVSAIGSIAKPSGNLHPKKGASKPAARPAKKAAPRLVKRAAPKGGAMPAKLTDRRKVAAASGGTAGTPGSLATDSRRTATSDRVPLIASARGRGSNTDSQERRMDLAGKLREQLGLADDVDDDAVFAAVAERLEQADDPGDTPDVIETEPAGDLVAASAADIDALVTARVEAALKPVTERLTLVSTELAQRKQSEAITVRDTVIASALADGKIKPSEKAAWEKDYDEAPGPITRVLASLAPNSAIVVHAAGRTGSTETTVSETDQAFWDQIQPGVNHG